MQTYGIGLSRIRKCATLRKLRACYEYDGMLYVETLGVRCSYGTQQHERRRETCPNIEANTNTQKKLRHIYAGTSRRNRRSPWCSGSGLGAFADELSEAVRVDYRDIPHFPRSTVAGHSGRLVVGYVDGVPVAAMQGRVHLYEGYSAREVAFPMRVLGRLGVKAVVLTNACGGINTNYKAGSLVVLKDHINMQGANPLIGPNDDRFGPRFPDMTHAYTKQYRESALEEARRLGLDVHEGVYVGLTGPSYETPAEIRAFRAMGADVVGMSTVAEAIVARHMGMKNSGNLVCGESGSGCFE